MPHPLSSVHQGSPSRFGRSEAATKLQTIFRGHKAREETDTERRKANFKLEQDRQEQEAAAARVPRVRRVALRSSYGF